MYVVGVMVMHDIGNIEMIPTGIKPVGVRFRFCGKKACGYHRGVPGGGQVTLSHAAGVDDRDDRVALEGVMYVVGVTVMHDIGS